jgi:hypothetical protein
MCSIFLFFLDLKQCAMVLGTLCPDTYLPVLGIEFNYIQYFIQ